jgi:hypothetical protein
MKAKQYAMIVVALGLVCGAGWLWFTADGWTYSTGSRAGIVIKFSEKGGFGEWDTHEGELQQGATVETWAFSVNESQDGTGILKQVEDAMDSGLRVKVHYRQQRGVQSWKGKTTYFVTSIESIGK